MKNISESQIAKLLGVSVGDLSTLEEQGIIHSPYSLKEVARIKSQQNPTLSEEAAQVGIQIQQEVVTSLTGLQKFKKRISVLSLFAAGLFVLSTIIIAVLFNIFPTETSDFFGYYYRFNRSPNVLSASTGDSNILQAATGSVDTPVKTSVLADIIKPVAGASLILVKAADGQKYEQIVTNPVLATGGLPGLAGSQGPPGPAGPSGAAGSDGISATDLSISDLTNENLSGSAGISNANLANSTLAITSGDGLSGGGLVSLGGSTSLDINLGANSGLETVDSSLTLLQGCADEQILKWTDAGGWACAADSNESELQHIVSYDSNQDMTNVTSSQATLATVSIIPASSAGDVYVTGQAEVFSSNGTDQPFTLVVETTDNCTGTTVGNASVTYTITSGANANNLRGVLVVSGVDLNPGTLQKSYSLCASTSAGDTDVQNWRLEALVIN